MVIQTEGIDVSVFFGFDCLFVKIGSVQCNIVLRNVIQCNIFLKFYLIMRHKFGIVWTTSLRVQTERVIKYQVQLMLIICPRHEMSSVFFF